MLLEIVTNPNPVLGKKAKAVSKVTPEIRELIKNMAETMYASSGVGLAANQIGRAIRVVVIDVSKDQSQLIALINPKITWKSPEKTVMAEGCLSVPGYEGDVERNNKIKIEASNLAEEVVTEGFLARAIQHELDHLDGKLYIDCLYGDTRLRPLESGAALE